MGGSAGRRRVRRSTAGASAQAQARAWARVRTDAQVDGGCAGHRRVRANALLTCDDGRGRGRAGAKSASSYAKVVKNPFSWKFHFSAYSVCPDKSFWSGKKSP